MAITEKVKVCCTCKVNKLLTDFTSNRTARDGLESRCKPCRAAAHKKLPKTEDRKQAAREATSRWRERTPLYRREAYVKARFNKTVAEVDAFVNDRLLATGIACESCGDLCSVVGKVKLPGTRRLVLDHCHTTGVLRGLLCDFCNTSLGKLGDSPAKVEKLLHYIRRFK